MNKKDILEKISKHVLIKKKEHFELQNKNEKIVFKNYLWKNSNLWILRLFETIMMLPLYVLALEPIMKKYELFSSLSNKDSLLIVLSLYMILFVFSCTPMMLALRITNNKKFYENCIFSKEIVDKETMDYLVSLLSKEDLKRYILSQKTMRNKNPILTYDALMNNEELSKFIESSNISLENLLEKMYDEKIINLKNQ